MPRTRKRSDGASAETVEATAVTEAAETPAVEALTASEAEAAAEAERTAAEEAEDRAAEEARHEVEAPPATPTSWPGDDTFVTGEPSITEPEPGHVRMAQASAASIRATNVEAHQSAAARVTGSTVNLSQGASGFVRGTDVHMEQGAVGAVAADHVEFHDGFAFLVVARRVSGQVTVLLDWRGVAAAIAVLLVLGRLLRGRR